MKSIHASCWHWSFISKMGTHMAGMAQVVDRHLGGHYSSSHLDSRVWGAPLLKLKSSMERLRFESYTGHYLQRMLVVPYTSSRGPEPRWEGNTDKVMYWHGLRMLRYSHCHPHSGIEFCESQPLLPRTVIIFLVIHCGQCWMSGTASTRLWWPIDHYIPVGIAIIHVMLQIMMPRFARSFDRNGRSQRCSILCSFVYSRLIRNRHGSWAGWAGNRPMATRPMGYGQVAGVY